MELSAIFDDEILYRFVDDMPMMIGATPERPEWETDSDTDVAFDEDTELEPPYRVIIHNDNITTFVFVIKVLTTIFQKNVMEADQIANRTHRNGIAVVGTYPKSVAETRINKVHFAAQLEAHALGIEENLRVEVIDVAPVEEELEIGVLVRDVPGHQWQLERVHPAAERAKDWVVERKRPPVEGKQRLDEPLALPKTRAESNLPPGKRVALPTRLQHRDESGSTEADEELHVHLGLLRFRHGRVREHGNRCEHWCLCQGENANRWRRYNARPRSCPR